MNPYKKYCKSWWKYYFLYLKPSYWKHQIEKLIYWLPIIWRQEEWDSMYLYELLEAKFIRLEKHAKIASCVATWETQAKDYMIAKNLCRRLKEDKYLNLDGYESWDDKKVRRMGKYEERLRKQDLEYLLNLIRRKIDTWWD